MMTVAELIEQLKHLDERLPVYVRHGDDYSSFTEVDGAHDTDMERLVRSKDGTWYPPTYEKLNIVLLE